MSHSVNLDAGASEAPLEWQAPKAWLQYGVGVRARALHKQAALLAWYAARDEGAAKKAANERAREEYRKLAGVLISTAQVRRWLRTIKTRGGRGAPLAAYCDAREVPHVASRLRVPTEFVAALKRKCLEPGVGMFSAAVRAFVLAWQAGAEVPGLGCAARLGEPFPYTVSQLRKFAPSKAAQVQAASGKFAVKTAGLIPAPPISSANLRLRERILFDDVRFDFVAIDDHTGQHVSLVGYFAMDESTRQILGYLVREDGAVRQTDVEGLCAFVLRVAGFAGRSAGYPTTLKFERGTVAISAEREALLSGLYPGEILVSRTSMIGGRNVPGDFAQSASGNWFGKGKLESFFRTLHAYLRHLAGQRGNCYANQPLMLGDLLTAPARIASPNYKAKGSMLEESVIAATNAQAVHWMETGETPGALESCRATGIRPPLLFVSEVNVALQAVIAFYNAERGHRREGFATIPAENGRGGCDWIAESANDKAERLTRELAHDGHSLSIISAADAAVLLHKCRRATVTANGARLRIGGRERLYWQPHSRAIAAAQHSSAGRKVFLALYNPEDPRELYVLDNPPGRLPATAEELPPEVAPVFLESLPLYEAPDANDETALLDRARQVQANTGRIGREILRNVLPFVEENTSRRERNLELSEPLRAAVSALRGPGKHHALPPTALAVNLSRAQANRGGTRTQYRRGGERRRRRFRRTVMSSTRRAAEDANPDDAPERYLASARLRGVGVGLNIVCRVARVLRREEREAMLFLANYARLCDLTAEDVSTELRLPWFEIRESLTNPDHDRTGFVRQVSKVRERFNAELEELRAPGEPSLFALVPAFDEAAQRIADTSIARKIANGFRMAAGIPQIVEIVGKSRMGKSIAARREFLKNLHRAAWLHCPKGGTERDWLNGLAGCLGMSFSSAQKNAQILPKIEACFGRGRIELLVVDEGHRLAPVEQDAEPRRLEFLRDLWEMRGVSVIVLATPQLTTALGALMAGNPRWAPAQWLGRVQQFKLPDTMTAKDLAAVARHHAPDAGEDAIAQLVTEAKSGEGFCGAVVAAIRRARFREEGGPLTLTAIVEAQRQLQRAERVNTLAAAKPVPFRRPRGTSGLANGDTARTGSPEPPGGHPPAAVGA